VKVLDIDRDRQRISLGLKQTQEDPWQRVVNTYRVGDELEGTVTKVVAFGAFVEILDGVEGLVHISELAHHHVENPREVVDPGQEVKVKILEIDAERRRLSLSVKRVEGQNLPLRSAGDLPPEQHVSEGDLVGAPDYALSEDIFAADAPTDSSQYPEAEELPPRPEPSPATGSVTAAVDDPDAAIAELEPAPEPAAEAEPTAEAEPAAEAAEPESAAEPEPAEPAEQADKDA
jgi:small subunit ribosomal protein S1